MILIGCPVYDRAWILPQWFEYIESQTWPLNDIGFLFVVSSKDTETLNELFKFQANHPEVPFFDVVHEGSVTHVAHKEYEDRLYYRNWSNKTALSRMVTLRNTMLARVRQVNPDRFFSLDSDILLTDPNTIARLHARTKFIADAASPLIYMSDNTQFPGVMRWRHDGPRVPQSNMPLAVRDYNWTMGDFFQTDVIMAAKMMNRSTYSKDYLYHPKGEDLGWSWNCRNNRLFSDSGVYASHIMSPKMLKLFNAFGDDRAPKCDTIKTVKVL